MKISTRVEVVDEINAGRLRKGAVQAVFDTDGSISLAHDDYCYDGGVCYSLVRLTKADVLALAALVLSK